MVVYGKHIKALCIFLCSFLTGTAVAVAQAEPMNQVWQWSVELKEVISNETNDHPQAFLWIPENCRQVRAVVIGQHNMIEEGIFEHPVFRKTMSDLGFAV